MKKEYWIELLKIFDEEIVDPEVRHRELYKTISLIVKTSALHDEIEELNKELTELNK